MKKIFQKSFYWLPLVITLAVYSQTIFFGTPWNDDNTVISPPARDFHLMLKSFYQNVPGLHFAPMYYLQAFIVNKIFGANAYPFGFHLYNLFLHLISCIFATAVCFKLFSNKFLSAVLVSLWTVHPLNVEAISRIGVGPGHVASGTFCLIFVYCLLRVLDSQLCIQKVLFLISGLLFFLASMTSCEQFFFFPFVLFLICIFLYGFKFLIKKENVFWIILPLCGIYFIYFLWRYYACAGNVFETSCELTKWSEFGTLKDALFRAFWLAPQLLVHYLKLFFYPDFLSDVQAEWFKIGKSLFSFYSLFCQVLVFGLILVCLFWFKKIPLFSIGVFWFLFSMVLIVQTIPLFVMVDQYYCYFSILGVFISLFAVIAKLNQKILLVILLLIFSLLSFRTIIYLQSNKDTFSYFISLYKHAPEETKVLHLFDALAYAEMQNKLKELPGDISYENFDHMVDAWLKKYLDKPIDLSHKFGPIQYAPNYILYKLLSLNLYHRGKKDELNKLIKHELEVKNNWLGWQQHADFLRYVKEWNPAWYSINRAISLNPVHYILYDSNFSEIAFNAGRFNEAEKLIKNFMLLKSNYSYPYLCAGVFYKTFGKDLQALNYYEQALLPEKVISINYKNMYIEAGRFFVTHKKYDLAAKAFSIVTSFDP